MFSQAFPMLSSPDLPRAVAFYRDQLGFTETYRFPPDGEPEYVGLSLDGARLGIGADGADAGPAPRYSMCVYADDCDRAVARLRAAGATVLAEPADQPWGERMAEVTDPDGNRIVIMTKL